MTGGITTIVCQHGYVRGATAIKKGESAKRIVEPIVKRLPTHVQASKRFWIYDNACQSRIAAERRFPHKIRNWIFVIDRVHWRNHTSCSKGYDMDIYPELDEVASPKCEILNKSLRNLSTVLAYLQWDNYTKLVEVFLAQRNINKKDREMK